MENLEKILSDSGTFSAIDIHFGRFIARLHGQKDRDIFLGAALVSRCAGEGDICLNLSAEAEKVLVHGHGGNDTLRCPSLSAWREKLLHSRVVGRPGQFFPLILDDQNRLYLYRYWHYEKDLADALISRAGHVVGDIDRSELKEGLGRLFPQENYNGVDWQKIAACTAVSKRLCIITGGPGTGKTFLIARILVLLLEQARGRQLNIFLSAPTGKAAVRLKETVRLAAKDIQCADAIKRSIPEEAYTIHRMLKPRAGSPYFRHNEDNPLPADVVIVDEASMVDLALMSKLIQAVPIDARLILMGDREQLASVEPGSVLGDMCDRNHIHGFSEPYRQMIADLTGEKLHKSADLRPPHSGLPDSMVALERGYRFSAGSGIDALSQAVIQGEAQKALELLKDDRHREITWQVISSADEMRVALAKKIRRGYSDYLKSAEPAEALGLFNRFMILCATRKGRFGVEAINRLVEEFLNRAGLIKGSDSAFGRYYPGQPILITQNSYALNLFNGDIGIAFSTKDDPRDDLQVFFPGPGHAPRGFTTARLPENETAYALTVHKSQGSEFENVLLILPEQDSPVLTRELLYTGITRARKTVTIWASENIFNLTVSRAIQRSSGLRDLLWSSKEE